jgi:membrane protein
VFGLHRHGGLGYAKGAAYSATLAFFPMLASLTTILVHANATAVSRKITETLFRVVPAGAEELVRQFFTERGLKPITLPVVAVMLSVWAASGVTISLMEGFQAAVDTPPGRGIIRQRLMGILLVMIGVLPVIGASVMMLFGDRTEATILHGMGLLPTDLAAVSGVLRLFSKLLRYTLIITSIMTVMSLYYYFGPEGKNRGRRILPGVLLATVLWLAVTMTFTWYVRNIANYNVLYGSIGAVIALLVWIDLLAMISLLGFEFNVAFRKT